MGSVDDNCHAPATIPTEAQIIRASCSWPAGLSAPSGPYRMTLKSVLPSCTSWSSIRHLAANNPSSSCVSGLHALSDASAERAIRRRRRRPNGRIASFIGVRKRLVPVPHKSFQPLLAVRFRSLRQRRNRHILRLPLSVRGLIHSRRSSRSTGRNGRRRSFSGPGLAAVPAGRHRQCCCERGDCKTACARGIRCA
jgi:hypothetical protein